MPSLSTSASFPLGEIGQFQIVQEQVDEFVAAENEAERIFAVALARPLPLPPLWLGRGSMSPSTNFLFPGNTMSRVPPSRRKRGSSMPSIGTLTSPPSRTSLMSRSCDDFFTAP